MRDAYEVLALRLPIGGRTYLAQPPTAEAGIRLMNMLEAGIRRDALASNGVHGADLDAATASLIVDDSDINFAHDCLGAAYDEMIADNVPPAMISLAMGTAFLAWTAGEAIAEAWWETGGKAPTPPKRPAGAPPTETQTQQAAATTTPTRVSRNGTKRRKRGKG